MALMMSASRPADLSVEIGSKPGAGQEALFYPIEELYTPLRAARVPGSRDTPMDAEGERAELAQEGMSEQVELKELLADHDRLLLLGEPGAGKTTFLQLITSVLARYLLAPPASGQPRGRELHLGLPAERPAPVPIFIRLADLASDPHDMVANHQCLLA